MNASLHIQQAEGLRALAAFIEANPQLANYFQYSLQTAGINAHLDDEDKLRQQATIARAALRTGATVDKDINERWHNVILHFGTVRVEVLAYREEVCERVQVGTETVTTLAKDPAALAAIPEVEVTEEVPVYEWKCKPLLDAGGSR